MNSPILIIVRHFHVDCLSIFVNSKEKTCQVKLEKENKKDNEKAHTKSERVFWKVSLIGYTFAK